MLSITEKVHTDLKKVVNTKLRILCVFLPKQPALYFVLIKLIKWFNRNQFVESVLEHYSLFNEFIIDFTSQPTLDESPLRNTKVHVNVRL